MIGGEDSNPTIGGPPDGDSGASPERGHYEAPGTHVEDRPEKASNAWTDFLTFDSLFKYDGEDWLSFESNYGLELSSSFSVEGRPSASMSLENSNKPVFERASLDIPLGGPGKLSLGADGSINIAAGNDMSLPGAEGVSVAGWEVSVNLRCPDEGKCYDFGAKAKGGPLSFKYEGRVGLGPGALRATQDLVRNLENAIRRSQF